MVKGKGIQDEYAKIMGNTQQTAGCELYKRATDSEYRPMLLPHPPFSDSPTKQSTKKLQ